MQDEEVKAILKQTTSTQGLVALLKTKNLLRHWHSRHLLDRRKILLAI